MCSVSTPIPRALEIKFFSKPLGDPNPAEAEGSSTADPAGRPPHDAREQPSPCAKFTRKPAEPKTD